MCFGMKLMSSFPNHTKKKNPNKAFGEIRMNMFRMLESLEKPVSVSTLKRSFTVHFMCRDLRHLFVFYH